jgi:ZIP family zinc transporter
MNNEIYALGLTILTGLASIIGWLIVILNKKLDKNKLIYFLGFTIGILLFITVFDLLPEAYEIFENNLKKYSAILLAAFILVGYLIAHAIDILLHHDEDEHHLTHMGKLTSFAVSLHKIPEAISLFLVSYADIKLGLLLTIAIMVHHIPEGIMISSPIYYETKSKKEALKYTVLSSLASPLGGAVAYLFSEKFNNDAILGILFALSVGMFIFLLIKEILPTALAYNQNKKLLISGIIGIVFIYICHIIIE